MVNRIRVHSVVDHWSVRSLAGYRTVRNRRTKLLNFLFRLNSVSSRLFLQSEGSHANLSSSALINRSTFLTMRNYTTYELFFHFCPSSSRPRLFSSPSPSLHSLLHSTSTLHTRQSGEMAEAALFQQLANLPKDENPYNFLANRLTSQIFPTLARSTINQLYFLAAILGL